MSPRSVRTIAATVVAVVAVWFVARPAFATISPDDAVRWRATLKEGPSDLAADGDGIAVTTSQQAVYLLGADGRVRWRADFADMSLGQPALGPDVVVVGGMASVAAYARADGAPLWTHPQADAANSLAVAAGTVLVGDDSGKLAALDPTSGAERWSVQYPGALWSGARVDPKRGAVVATWHQAESPAVRVFDLATGELRWEAPTDRFTAAPVLRAGLVVLAVGDGNRHARVEARDLRTGSPRWRTRVPASFEEAIEPAADGREVAVVDHFGVVTVLDLATGHLRWQHDLADVVLATRVVLTDRRVAFTSYKGVLHVLDRRDGHVVQTLAPTRLGGLPVGMVRAPSARRGAVLLAVRMIDWGVQLRRLS